MREIDAKYKRRADEREVGLDRGRRGGEVRDM